MSDSMASSRWSFSRLNSDTNVKLGEISFRDAAGVEENDAKAAIFSESSEANEAVEVLRKWGIFKPILKPIFKNKPELMITVIGGAGYFNLNSSIRKNFRDGLVDAAIKSDALVLTGGTFDGAVLHTGKALRQKAVKINTIGFTSFAVIKHNEKMDEQFVAFNEEMR